LAVFTPTGLRADEKNSKNQSPDDKTTTPIKHIVVIYQENVSFDHYFGTYPFSENHPGEITFHAKANTPTVNNLESAGLLHNNTNLDASGNRANPFRIPPSIPVTCDNDHDYNDEQFAFHGGLMDRFVTPLTSLGESGTVSCVDSVLGPNTAMGYYDGNTLTAFWNYAQHFAMSDNSYSTTFGPSSPGAINLISGNTFAATLSPLKANGKPASAGDQVAGFAADPSVTVGALIGDARPHLDDCVQTTPGLAGANQVTMSGKNVGDLLNAKGITWGWFQGGFAPTGTKNGLAVCGQHHSGLAGDDATTQSSDGDYIPHHQPFQYFPSTVNPHHTRPSDSALIGTSADGTNHQYDIVDFNTSLSEGRLPAVTYIKAPAYQDGHAGYSDPIDEQFFVVNVINSIMRSSFWRSTAIIIAYDDSDGWYDHQMSPIVNQSNSTGDDQLLTSGVTTGTCGTPIPIDNMGTIQNGRCGYGPRQPLLVISPFAKRNFVDHGISDQSSILQLIEDNWGLGRIGGGSADAIAGTLLNMFDFNGHANKLILDPTTGQILRDED